MAAVDVAAKPDCDSKNDSCVRADVFDSEEWAEVSVSALLGAGAIPLGVDVEVVSDSS